MSHRVGKKTAGKPLCDKGYWPCGDLIGQIHPHLNLFNAENQHARMSNSLTLRNLQEGRIVAATSSTSNRTLPPIHHHRSTTTTRGPPPPPPPPRSNHPSSVTTPTHTPTHQTTHLTSNSTTNSSSSGGGGSSDNNNNVDWHLQSINSRTILDDASASSSSSSIKNIQSKYIVDVADDQKNTTGQDEGKTTTKLMDHKRKNKLITSIDINSEFKKITSTKMLKKKKVDGDRDEDGDGSQQDRSSSSSSSSSNSSSNNKKKKRLSRKNQLGYIRKIRTIHKHRVLRLEKVRENHEKNLLEHRRNLMSMQAEQ